MNTKLGHLEIFVKDPLKSKDFYIDVLGFELVDVQDDKFVWVKLGDSLLLLRPGKNCPKSDTYQDTNMAMVIYCNDCAEILNHYKTKGLVTKGDDTGNAVFTDLDGNWFQLANPGEHH
jgi:catechol 2,3-dioxygenase-like lactoylglutathione lyase family enzyme